MLSFSLALASYVLVQCAQNPREYRHWAGKTYNNKTEHNSCKNTSLRYSVSVYASCNLCVFTLCLCVCVLALHISLVVVAVNGHRLSRLDVCWAAHNLFYFGYSLTKKNAIVGIANKSCPIGCHFPTEFANNIQMTTTRRRYIAKGGAEMGYINASRRLLSAVLEASRCHISHITRTLSHIALIYIF